MPVKILKTLFHLLTLFVLIITLNLLLDFRLRGNHFLTDTYREINLLTTFITISFMTGITSVILLVLKWIKDDKLELYLISFLITNIILILGITLLIFM